MQRGLLLLLLLLASTGCRSLGTPVAAPHTTTPWLELQYGPGMIGPPSWRALITEHGEVSLVVAERVYRQRLSTRDITSLRTLLRSVTPEACRTVAGGQRRRRATSGDGATTICTPAGCRSATPAGVAMMVVVIRWWRACGADHRLPSCTPPA